MSQIHSKDHAGSMARVSNRFPMRIVVAGFSVLFLHLGTAHGQTPDRANTKIEPTSQVAPRVVSELSATQALQRMLELLRVSGRVADMTPEKVNAVFGVQVKILARDRFGYGQRLPGNWAFGLERVPSGTAAANMTLGFDPIPGTQASPLNACEPDYAHFTAALESMGFARHAQRGEHGRLLFDGFERRGLQVEVYPESSLTSTGELTGPACVKMVMVR